MFIQDIVVPLSCQTKTTALVTKHFNLYIMAHYLSSKIAEASKTINAAKANLNKIDSALYTCTTCRDYNRLNAAERDTIMEAKKALEDLLFSINIKLETIDMLSK